MYSPNFHLSGREEKNGAQRRSFDRAMMQALELLWLAKRHVLAQSGNEQ